MPQKVLPRLTQISRMEISIARVLLIARLRRYCRKLISVGVLQPFDTSDSYVGTLSFEDIQCLLGLLRPLYQSIKSRANTPWRYPVKQKIVLRGTEDDKTWNKVKTLERVFFIEDMN